jgi:hypothetical protein
LLVYQIIDGLTFWSCICPPAFSEDGEGKEAGEVLPHEEVCYQGLDQNCEMLSLAYHRLFLCPGSVLCFDLYGHLLWESMVYFLCYLKCLDWFKGQFVLALKSCLFVLKNAMSAV